MKLTLNRPHLSLKDIPTPDLPAFTLITGVNGAGKSHLLQALQNGSAVADIAPNPAQEIRFFDWNNLVPKEEGDFDVSTLRQEQLQLYRHLENMQKQQFAPLLFANARNQGISGPRASDAQWLSSASPDELAAATQHGAASAGSAIRTHLDNILRDIKGNILNQMNAQQRPQLEAICDASGKHPLLLRYDDFAQPAKPAWGHADLFQQSFARLFVAYRELYQMNKLAQMAQAEGDAHAPALTKDAFREKYGDPPWDFVNSSLRAAGMEFTIDAPSLFSTGTYRPKLHKKGSDAEILFTGLSSGERILMSFAFAVYYAADVRQQLSRPKLLLLDEIDAPLHPSMCKSLLAMIQHVLIKQYGLHVMMATHSPSTVALAPEDAIHVMRPNIPGLFKVTKESALKDLTDGVPTLSLSYDGRRQVFVESPRDVDVYQAAYDALKRHVQSELVLNFIATGSESSSGTHINTGCENVKRLVREMRSAGAKHTFGLIDWDGINSSDDGIFVLAEGARDGLESVFLDPLLLLNTIVRQAGLQAVSFAWPVGTSYISLADMNVADLQRAVDTIQLKVLGRPRAESASVDYIGAFSLKIDVGYLTMDDHELERAVLQGYPQLNAIARNRPGELLKWISRTVLHERISHTPTCLLSIFERIVAH